jgi:class 3 adenylate cyclase
VAKDELQSPPIYLFTPVERVDVCWSIADVREPINVRFQGHLPLRDSTPVSFNPRQRFSGLEGPHLGGNRVERRLSAVVAADVAGYSRLMGLDEVGTARTLREHRAVTDGLVAKHGGRLVKTTGDGVLLEFPSVVDAVECAVAVQAVMDQRNEGVPVDRRMLFRIGINLGDILIEGDDILGDGVNIAARLEGIAEPGSICISSSAYDQVRGKVEVEFADLGEQRLKNIDRPVRVYTAKSRGHVGMVGLDASSHHDVQKPLPLPDKPSIAVLPFQNMSGAVRLPSMPWRRRKAWRALPTCQTIIMMIRSSCSSKSRRYCL